MKQLIQNLKNGEISLVNIPKPSVKRNHVLIKVKKSLISVGTEKMLLSFGKANWLNKAKQQPDKVKMIIDKVKTDGLKPTIETVQNKLDTPIPLGYSCSGVIEAIGAGVTEFRVGDRVISNGNHSEYVCVSKNLVAKIPDQVSDNEAAFTVVGSIALQGVRLLKPQLDETVVVIGLGLIGLVTVQLLKANGCRVIGIDLDLDKCHRAEKYGAIVLNSSDNNEIESNIFEISSGLGADSVIITASTKSNQPIDLAPRICRHRGKVVLVGVVGLELNRTEFFKKEISFQVSCSYGPGRYDVNYEDKAMDYPVGYVRWTENRNFQAILSLLEQEKLDFNSLITNVENFNDAKDVYTKLIESKNVLGAIFRYDDEDNIHSKNITMNPPKLSNDITVAIIGAGGFTTGVLLPILKKQNVRLKYICSSTGLSGYNASQRFKIENNTTDIQVILNDSEVNTIFIMTPHNSHGELVLKSLHSGKNVFVEKPLSLYLDEISNIEEFYFDNDNSMKPVLTVGFNRRFSSLVNKLKMKLGSLPQIKSFIYTINAGEISMDHWIQDDQVGGGRLIGECCHFVDLLRFLAGSEIVESSVTFADLKSKDTFIISLKFNDGSIGVINYFSNGNKKIPKERLEVFCGGNFFCIENFKRLLSIDKSGRRLIDKLSNQNKGHEEEIVSFFDSVRDGNFSIPLNEVFEVSKLTLSLNG